MYNTRSLNGDGYMIKYPKSAGYYRNIKTGEVQFLWNKCKGWRQITFYGQNI
jgi:hypothetical protein